MVNNYTFRSDLRRDLQGSIKISKENQDARPVFDMAKKSFMLDPTNLPAYKSKLYFQPAREYIGLMKSDTPGPNIKYAQQYCPPYYSKYDICPSSVSYNALMNNQGRL